MILLLKRCLSRSSWSRQSRRNQRQGFSVPKYQRPLTYEEKQYLKGLAMKGDMNKTIAGTYVGREGLSANILGHITKILARDEIARVGRHALSFRLKFIICHPDGAVSVLGNNSDGHVTAGDYDADMQDGSNGSQRQSTRHDGFCLDTGNGSEALLLQVPPSFNAQQDLSSQKQISATLTLYHRTQTLQKTTIADTQSPCIDEAPLGMPDLHIRIRDP